MKWESDGPCSILVISDLHGNAERALEALDNQRPDLVLCCGDWGDAGQLPTSVYEQFIERALLLTVYGNHDDLALLPQLRNRDGSPILIPNGQTRNWRGLTIAGIGGIWAKSHRRPCYVTDEDVRRFAQALENRGTDILLAHSCPIGLADATPGGGRGGKRCFLEALRTVSPRLYLCGHVHVQQRRDLKNGQTIVNVGLSGNGDYAVTRVSDDGSFDTELFPGQDA